LRTTVGIDHEEATGVPTAEKLVMPAGYGATTRTLTWESVRARL
jgi:hypothetical protein